MIKQFKQILSKYVDKTASKEEEALVDKYFERMQVKGLSPNNVTSSQGEEIKEKIDKRIKPKKKSSRTLYYKVAAVAVVLLSLSYAMFYTKEDLEFVEHYADKGQQLQFYLSDSTYVHLNSNSKLIYPKIFNGSIREVQLVGEAFFEVKHTSTDTPFIVVSPKLNTHVLGTKFNVNDSPNETVEVSVYEGKVKVEDKQSHNSVVLIKNERVTLVNHDDLSKSTLEEGQFNLWYKGEVKFNQMRIDEVVTVLNRRFNIRLKLPAGEIPTTTISGDFTSDKVSDILQSLQFIYGVKYQKQKDGQIVLYLK